MGRETLLDTIQSLKNLSIPKWKAIIIFDGIKNNFDIKDTRIKIIEVEKKKGETNLGSRAGLVRNIAFDFVETEWIGFVDDDDYLYPNYIQCLKKEIAQNENIDVCLFRMAFDNNFILPSIYDISINKGRCGISFAVKKDVATDNKFENSNYEDYYFLKKLEYKGYKIVISPYITYFVRIEPYDCTKCNSRIYIN